MQLVIRMDCDNEAFDADNGLASEVHRVLLQVVDTLAEGIVSGMLRDSNGNTVGEFVYSGHAERERQRG